MWFGWQAALPGFPSSLKSKSVEKSPTLRCSQVLPAFLATLIPQPRPLGGVGNVGIGIVISGCAAGVWDGSSAPGSIRRIQIHW